MPVIWEIWKERNVRVFDREECYTQALLAKIMSGHERDNRLAESRCEAF
ncbi:hypothetical protein HU200_063770 [Digitaria exilis]|uniref:Uncharacterized protein n=1 Tax=Digitaria exilis TaxID=1010633 RepID=A0A835DV34_9POAL|nr:hypothetical protein HU200_063770 [Digitaria exilis]